MDTITIIIGSSDASDQRTGFAGFIDSIEWGNAPAWATIIVATYAAILAYRALRRERRRDAVAAELRIQTQAAKFAVWNPVDGVFSLVKWTNQSDLPVTKVRIVLLSMARSDAIDRLLASYAEDRAAMPKVHRFEHTVGTVGPGEDAQVNVSSSFKPKEMIAIFTDAQGVTWERSVDGLRTTTAKAQPKWLEMNRRIEASTRLGRISARLAPLSLILAVFVASKIIGAD